MEDTPKYNKPYRNSPSKIDKQDFRSSRNLYTAIPLYFTRSKKVDGYMKALLLELLSYPAEDWVINKNVVQRTLKFPEKKFLTAWKALTDLGYISKERFQGGVKWIVTDNPANTTDYRGEAAEGALEYVKSSILK